MILRIREEEPLADRKKRALASASRLVFQESGQIPGAVDEGSNLDLAVLDAVDQAVALDEELSDPRRRDFGDDAASFGEIAQRARRCTHILDEGRSVYAGSFSEVPGGLIQIVEREIGPPYTSSHFAIRRSATSWSTRRPSSAARSPSSTFWRT